MLSPSSPSDIASRFNLMMREVESANMSRQTTAYILDFLSEQKDIEVQTAIALLERQEALNG